MLLVSCRDHFAPHWYYRGLGPGAHNAVFHYDTRPQCYAPWNNNYTRVWDPNPPHTVIFMIHKTLPGLDSQPQPSYKARPDPPTCLWCDKSFKYSFIGCWLECCETAFSDENAGELWAHHTLHQVLLWINRFVTRGVITSPLAVSGVKQLKHSQYISESGWNCPTGVLFLPPP